MKTLSLLMACVLWAGALAAQGLTDAEKTLFVAFADAVSDGDAAAIAVAEGFVESPPTTLETIGFYGMERAAPEARAARGIISYLADEGFLISIEVDLLPFEFVPVLAGAGIVADRAEIPDVFGQDVFDLDWDDAQVRVQAAEVFSQNFGTFAHAVEAQAAAQGLVLMQVTMPLGDTVFYWAAPPEVAEEWLCVLLVLQATPLQLGQSNEIAVQSVRWLEFYRLLEGEFTQSSQVMFMPDGLPEGSCVVPQV